MANTYTYSGPATRWSEGDPTAVDFLNVSRVNSDHLYEALNTILVTSGVTSGAASTLVSHTQTNTQSPGNNSTRIATTAFVTAAVSASSTSPGGSNTQIQYNNSGAFGGSANLTFDGTTMNVVGNAGVGIARTDGTLHVHTATAGSVAPNANEDDLVIENSTHCGITILAPDASDSTLCFGSASDAVGAILRWNHDANLLKLSTANAGDKLTFSTAADVLAMTIDSSQNVGIGNAMTSSYIGAVHGLVIGDNSDLTSEIVLAATNLGESALNFTDLSNGSNRAWVKFSHNDEILDLNTTNTTRFLVEGSEKMRVIPDGTVKIGETGAATNRILHAKGAIGFGMGNSASTAGNNKLFGFYGTLVADNSARTLLQQITGGLGAGYFVAGMARDSATGFVDIIVTSAGAVAVVSSTTTKGSPGARTYSVVSENIKLAINDSSETYHININGLGTNGLASGSTPTIGA